MANVSPEFNLGTEHIKGRVESFFQDEQSNAGLKMKGMALLRRLALVSCLATLGNVAPAEASPSHSIEKLLKEVSNSYQQSSNWSGYEASAPNYLDFVKEAWVVPSVSCTIAETDSSVWVGVGTGTSSSDILYQTGVAINCDLGTPSYKAWWEEVPGNTEQDYTGVTVRPGDKIVTEVLPHSSDGVDLYVYDFPNNGSPYFNWVKETVIGRSTNPSKVECIVERPELSTLNNSFYALLTNFGTIDFPADSITDSNNRGCDVVANNTDHIISSTGSGLTGITRIDMYDSDLNKPIATTSTQTSTGEYNVMWQGYN